MSARQLYALGFAPAQITRAMHRGHLHRVHRGVYAVGHPNLTLHGRWMAAVLAAGQPAALSHVQAAVLSNLRTAHGNPIHVTAPGHYARKLTGVRVHGVRALNPADVTVKHGIPVTTVARTLLDQAGVLPVQRLRLEIEAADRLDLLDGRELAALLARSAGRRGVKPLRAALREWEGFSRWTQSELERAFLMLIEQAGLPQPQCNVLVQGELVDCFWPGVPLVVELDGWAWHRTKRSFESDRRRDAKLQTYGIPVLRFTQPRVEHEPEQVAQTLDKMLHRPR